MRETSGPPEQWEQRAEQRPVAPPSHVLSFPTPAVRRRPRKKEVNGTRRGREMRDQEESRWEVE